MSDDRGPYAPQIATEPPGPPRAPPRRWMPACIGCGAGCAVLVVLGIIGIVILARGAAGSFGRADQAARLFMQRVSDRQDDAAYASVSNGWKANSSRKDFGRYADYWRGSQGTLRTATVSGSNWYAGTGGTRITIAYTVQGSAGRGTVTTVMVEESGHFAVLSCNFTPHR